MSRLHPQMRCQRCRVSLPADHPEGTVLCPACADAQARVLRGSRVTIARTAVALYEEQPKLSACDALTACYGRPTGVSPALAQAYARLAGRIEGAVPLSAAEAPLPVHAAEERLGRAGMLDLMMEAKV